MKKTFDAVAVMREAREKLAAEWEGKPREQEIDSLTNSSSPRSTVLKVAHHGSNDDQHEGYKAKQDQNYLSVQYRSQRGSWVAVRTCLLNTGQNQKPEDV